MTTTSEMRKAWAPACTGPFARVSLHGDGVVTVRLSTVAAWNALNEVLKHYNYKTRKADTGAYNCRPITGGTAYSLHAYGIAVDINWMTNPYGPKLITDMPLEMILTIENLRTKNGRRLFRWGGRYQGNKDAMHFEIICTPADLATGIAIHDPAPPTRPPELPPIPQSAEVADMYIIVAGLGFFAQFGNVTLKLNISMAEMTELIRKENAVPVMYLPESAKQDWFNLAIRQTQHATS